MYRVKNLEDFEKLAYEDLEIYIEKPLLYDGSEFLIPYEDRYIMKISHENLRIEKLEKKK
jgi:hypothetical protein